MPSLYKYLPSEYAPNLIDRGEILFRNLTYFRQYEGKVRGDAYEGIHKDHPGTDIVLENLTQGTKLIGKYSYLNSTNSDYIFTFCLSECKSYKLMDEFKCDACIEFFEPEEFIRRVRFKLAQLISVHSVGLLAQSVYYYDPSQPSLFDIKDPKKLAFVKNMSYVEQSEFRLSFGTRRAFKLIQQIA